MFRQCSFLALLFVVILGMSTAAYAGPVVNESARQIPVAYDVDVVVVGGSTGAVAAAVAAAEDGASVFLATPKTYLGDDMTGTLRLWLEPGEVPTSPLAKQIFSDTGTPPQADRSPNAIKFTYQADQPSAGVHKDTRKPSMLTDGRWADSARQSVQYDADVNITADLKKPQEIKEVRLMFFRRTNGVGGTNFDVAAMTVSTSDDGKTWKKVAEIKNTKPKPGFGTLVCPIDGKARYVKIFVQKPAGMERTLLGEIEIVGKKKQAKPQPPKAEAAAYPPPRPMHIKRTLDQALLDAGVKYLYGCYATDVLRDAAGNPCGIVMANRAGRQAVIAKVIIDATPRAAVARMAGAKFRPYPTGDQELKYIVIGGKPREGKNLKVREIQPPFGGRGGPHRIFEYTMTIPMAADDDASWAAAEQAFRNATYDPNQQFTANDLFQVPPDAIFGTKEKTFGPFRSTAAPRLWVLGGCADLDRNDAAKLMRPLALIDAGTMIGKAAAAEAKSLPKPKDVKLAGPKPSDRSADAGDTREMLQGVRPVGKSPTILQDARAIPVLGKYDVVVIGGGTSGAPAGISAARQGAKTLVVEYQHMLGGVGTTGAISKYYHGNRVGFTNEVPGTGWIIEQRANWWRDELLKPGGELWFGCIGAGAFVEDGKVKGAVVVTPRGRGVVLADVVIDGTGNSDVAAAAGAETLYTGSDELAMQGTGLPPRNLGASYTNTDFTLVDETDIVDMWHVFVYAKDKYPTAFDQGTLIDTRERRCIVGDHILSVLDEINERTYPDTISQARGGPYDTHGYMVHPCLHVMHPNTHRTIVNIPYRCVLPKGLEGILVVGLGMSTHRDAVPLIRMQPDMQNLGYAAGYTAAVAAKNNQRLRSVDVKAIQKHLVDVGNLEKEVLTDKDSYPLSDEAIAKAVNEFGSDPKHASVIFASPKQSLPMLREAYKKATSEAKPRYAFVLAMMGDPTALDDVIAQVRKHDGWDKGWNYRGMGQFGESLSPLDKAIVALGRTGDKRALPAILEKTALLDPGVVFSHHRATALALESIGDPAAAKPIYDVLQKPGMIGFAHHDIQKARKLGVPGGTTGEQTRRESLRELFLARALYRCGDHKGLGEKILRSYTKDLRGHLARHAQAVLDAGK